MRSDVSSCLHGRKCTGVQDTDLDDLECNVAVFTAYVNMMSTSEIRSQRDDARRGNGPVISSEPDLDAHDSVSDKARRNTRLILEYLQSRNDPNRACGPQYTARWRKSRRSGRDGNHLPIGSRMANSEPHIIQHTTQRPSLGDRQARG
jgi:hypothetical protein